MKNKRLLYVLLPAVLLIWGLIFQRIWSATTGPEEVADPGIPAMAAATRYNPAHHPPALLLAYADPFRATRTAPEARPASGFSLSPTAGRRLAQALNLPVAPPAPVPVVWPQLKFLGSITNARRNSCIALMSIDNKETMIKIGEAKQAVQVSKIFRDSVQVLFQGQKKTIKRSEAI